MGAVLYLNEPPADYVGNPQVEDGHTKIANELLDAIIRFDFTKRELNLVLFVIRKTYGYNKKQDWIALSQFSIGTGFSKGNVSEAIKALVSKNVFLKQELKNIYVIGLNKNYTKWNSSQNRNKGSQIGKGGFPKQEPQKTNIQKTIIYIHGKFEIPDSYISTWSTAYPGVDIQTEISKAGAWCLSNPSKAPKSAYARFLNGWLSRSKPSQQPPEDSEKQDCEAW